MPRTGPRPHRFPAGWRAGCCWLVMLWLGSIEGTAAPEARAWTVATYNVENYTVADRMVEGRYAEAYPKPEAAKAALRTVLRRIDADVLALQEIGGAEHLRELQHDLAAEGLAYGHAELLEAADADRRVAILSKLPLVAVVRHTDLTFSYFGTKAAVKRGLLEVDVRPTEGGPTVRLFVVHLKSRYTERPDDPLSAVRRAGEATAVRNRVWERCPEPASTPFLIVGDCNDSMVARPVRALVERGARVSTVWQPFVDSRGEGWTHHYAKEDSYTRVDHILVSPALVPQIVRGWIEDGDGVREASDHRPVVVRLRAATP